VIKARYRLMVVIIYLIFIITFAVMPADKNPAPLYLLPGEFWQHLGSLFFLTVLYYWYARGRGCSRRGAIARAAVFSIVIGIVIEAIQYPLPYRVAELKDLKADIYGIITALVLMGIMPARKKG